MKIQTIFKKSVVFSTVMLLCLLMALMSVPVMADEVTYAAEVYNVSYDANGNKTETFVAGYDTVAGAFKAASENQLIKLYQDANLTLNPHQTYKVDKNGHLLSVASNAGFGAKIVENRDGTVTVSTYKNQGEWYKKMDVAVAGTFGMRFYFSGLGTLAENDNAYLEVKVPKRDKSYEVTKLYKKDFKVDEEGLYYFVVEVAQAQLTDSISFQIVNGTEKGRLRQYAFRDYADKLFAEADKTGAAEAITEAVAPVKKMLNLGAQAQTLFNYNTEDLANKGLYDKDSNPVNKDTITSTKEILAEVGEAKKVATTKINTAEYSLYLQSQTALQFRFIVTDLAEGEIPTAAISYGGNATQKAGVAQGKLNDGKTDCWYVSISNIPAKLYDTVFTVTFKCGGETATYSASVLQWINAALVKGSDNQKNTATALYQYYLEMNSDKQDVVKPQDCQCTNTHVEILEAATCAAAGKGQTVCSDCGKILDTDVVITKLENHSYKTYAEVAATCTSDGWSAYTQCTVCGDMNSTTKTVLEAQGHTYTEFTYEYNGKELTKIGTCTNENCGEQVTEIISLAGTVESVTIDETPLDKLGETDSYDWNSKAATTVTVTGTDGSYAYNIGNGYVAFDNGKSFTVPTLEDTVTVTIGYQHEGTEFYVPVAIIYNVGECGHDGTLSTEWIKGEGYADVCSKCGYVGDAKPFKWTKDNTSMYNSTKDNGFTVTNNDGYVSYVVNDTTDLGTNRYAGKSERNIYIINGNADANKVGRYMIIKYRANTAYVGDIQVYATTLSGGITTNYDLLDENGNKQYKATNTTTGDTEYVALVDGSAPAGYTLVLDEKGNKISKKSSTIEFDTSINLVKEATLTEGSEWQIAVLDLDARIQPYTVNDGYNKPYVVDPFEEKDGKYAIQSVRFDYINNAYGSAVGAQLDIAYVGFCNDANEVKSIVSADANANCNHSAVDTDANGNALWYSAPGNAEHWNICLGCGEDINATAHKSVEVVSKGNGETHTAKCTDCGVEFNASCTTADLVYNNVSKMYDGRCACGAIAEAGKSYFLVQKESATSDVQANLTVTKLNEDDIDFIRYSYSGTQGAASNYFHVYQGSTDVVTGQYFVIKYRFPEGHETSDTSFVTFAATANKDPNLADGNGDEYGEKGTIDVSNTGWRIMVLDFGTKPKADFAVDANGNYCASFVRLGWQSIRTSDEGVEPATYTQFDVDFVAWADSLDAIANYIKATGSADYCTHDQTYTVDNGDTHTASCVCGKDETTELHVSTTVVRNDDGTHKAVCSCGKVLNESVPCSATAPGTYNEGTDMYDSTCKCGNTVSTKLNWVLAGKTYLDKVMSYGEGASLQRYNVLNGKEVFATEDDPYHISFEVREGAKTLIFTNFASLASGTDTGRYLAIKYRMNMGDEKSASTITNITAYTSSTGASAAGGDYQSGIPGKFTADADWHVYLLDLNVHKSITVGADGKTTVRYLRLDLGLPSGVTFGANASMDIAYFAFANDASELAEFVGETYMEGHTCIADGIALETGKTETTHNESCVYCNKPVAVAHTESDGYAWSDSEGKYILSCTKCNGTIDSQPFSVTVDAEYWASKAGHDKLTKELSADGSTVKYTVAETIDGGGERYLYPNMSDYTFQGRYLVVKFQTSSDYVGGLEIYTNTAGGTTGITNTSGTTNTSKSIADADKGNGWHLYIIDLEKIGEKTYSAGDNLGQTVDAWDPTKPATGIRFDYINGAGAAPVGSWIEFEYFAIVSEKELVKVLTAENGSEGAFCAHNSTENTFIEDAYYDVCIYCGDLLEDTKRPYFVTLMPDQILKPSGSKVVDATETEVAYLDVNGRTTDANDFYWRLYDVTQGDMTTETGKYLIMKYRTWTRTSTTVFVCTTTSSETAGGTTGKTGSLALTKNAEGDYSWHVLVLDLTTKFSKVTPEVDTDGDGTPDAYSINYFRLGFGAVAANADLIEIAYLGFSNDLDKVQAALQANGDTAYCAHSNTESTFVEDAYYDACIYCGEILEDTKRPFTVILDYNWISTKYNVAGTTEDLSDGIGVKYTTGASGAGGDATGRINVTTAYTTLGRYMIIKYKNSGKQTRFEVNLKSGEQYTSYKGKSYTMVTDDSENWHTLVVDLYDYYNQLVLDENGNFAAKEFLIDFHDATTVEGDWIELAYVGFEGNIDNLHTALQANGDAAYCAHTFSGFEFNAENGLYEKKCSLCGTVSETSSVKVKIDTSKFAVAKSHYTEKWVSGGTNTVAGTTQIATNTKIVDEYGNVSYRTEFVFDEAANADKFYAPGHKEAFVNGVNGNKLTGHYLLMKVKANKEKPMQLYVKDTSRYITFNLTGANEDNWTTYVVDLTKLTVGDALTADENGEYVINYLRVDFFDGVDHTLGDYIEFAEMGIIDTLDAVQGDYTAINFTKPAAQIEVTTDKTEYAAGETVTATLTLGNNPGFNAMPIALTYTDSEGTVTVVEEYTVESCATGFTEGDTMLVEKEDTTDYTANGELVTLTFAAPAEAGEYEIGWIVSEDDQIVNANEEVVAFVAKTTTITVAE